jgi:hypothetical protein
MATDGARPTRATRKWNADSLRRARVKIDATACKVFREFFSTFVMADTWIYLFLDASPQWKGSEIFACTMELNSKSASYFLPTTLDAPHHRRSKDVRPTWERVHAFVANIFDGRAIVPTDLRIS